MSTGLTRNGRFHELFFVQCRAFLQHGFTLHIRSAMLAVAVVRNEARRGGIWRPSFFSCSVIPPVSATWSTQFWVDNAWSRHGFDQIPFIGWRWS